jgi:hypothetical protein
VQAGQEYSAAAAALDGGSIALYIASLLRLSRHLGSIAFSSRAWPEILDGTEGLPASLCRFETAARCRGGGGSFYQLPVS